MFNTCWRGDVSHVTQNITTPDFSESIGVRAFEKSNAQILREVKSKRMKTKL